MTRPADLERTDLLASAVAGNELAFRQIIIEHHEDMRRVCIAIAGDHVIADEAVQAAWIVASKKLATVHGPASVVTVVSTRSGIRRDGAVARARKTTNTASFAVIGTFT